MDGRPDPWGGKLPPERAEEVQKKKRENLPSESEIPSIPEMMRDKFPTRLVDAWERGQPLFFIRTKRGEWLPRFAWVTKDRMHWLKAQVNYWDPSFWFEDKDGRIKRTICEANESHDPDALTLHWDQDYVRWNW